MIVIGTRPSKLALWQANHVKTLLSELGVEARLETITTKGDQILDRSLVEIGGKGLFLKEIEDALLAGKVDIAVHSLKDVPYELDEKLVLAAFLPREDASDAFLSKKFASLADLPKGAKVGTTSLRRIVQLRVLRPDLNFVPLRGNVDTRLKKLFAGEFDAIVLAAAGLNRLGLAPHITQRLQTVPAVGQGAITIECLAARADLLTLLSPLNHEPTARAVTVERKFLKLFQGSCQTPIGCLAIPAAQTAGHFTFTYFLADADGSNVHTGTLGGPWADGDKILKQIVK
jgi:hydroxymethylbilane synthase